MEKRRRQFLKSLGITSAIGIAGCSQRLEPDNRDKSSSTEDSSDTDEQNSTDNESTSDDSDNEEPENAEEEGFPDEGKLTITMGEDAEPLGPEGVFDHGDTQTTINIPYTQEEFNEEYHANRLKKIAEKEYSGRNAKTLKELAQKIADEEGEWIVDNIGKKMGEGYWGDVEPYNVFNFNEYMKEDAPFDERYIESNYPELWNQIAHVVLGGPDSGNDYIKTAAIGATEYYAAGRENNITFNTKTNDDTHGLGWINKVKWEPSEEQSVNVIETDPNNEEQVFDGPVYPDQTVWTEQEDINSAEYAWVMIGSATEKDDYNGFNIDIKEMYEFAEALHNPGEYALKPIAVSSMLMEYLNDEAVEDGNHPELEGYNYTVKPVSGEIGFY